jgi:glycosyltransferase involved in cell wall biosynthesis
MMKRLRILHVITTIDAGGAENQLLLLAKGQVQFGHIVSVIGLKGNQELRQQFNQAGIQVREELVNRRIWKQIWKLSRVMKQVKPDIVHAHLPRAELLCSLLSKKHRNISLICSKHNAEPFFKYAGTFLSKKISLFVERNSQATICISEAVRNYLIYRLRELSSLRKTWVVHYGYESQESSSNHINSWVQSNDPNTVNNLRRLVCVARLVPQKNLTNLVKAISICPQKDLTLDIYGDGELRDDLQNAIDALNLQKRIRLKGRTQTLHNELVKYEVFVLPSNYEGFGLSLLEAMDCGLRLCISDIEVFKEILGRNYSHYFNQNSPDEIAAALSKIVQDTETDFSLIYRNILDRFQLKAMCDKVNSVYYDSMEQRN